MNPAVVVRLAHASATRRSSISSLLLLGTVLCGALQPLSGALIDRLGARGVCCASMLLHALGLLVLAAARGPGALGLGFVIVRVGGISGTFLAQDAVLTKWYVRSRGTVVAVQRCVMAVGAISAIPMAVGAAIPRVGWRGTLVALALPLMLAVPTAGAFLLPTPESAGVRPDGDKAAPADVARAGAEGEELLPLACDDAACTTLAGGTRSSAAPPAPTVADEEVMWTVREALRCRVFWSLLGIGLAVCCCTGGITAHTPLIAADAGLDLPAMSRAVLLPSAIVALFANFGAGRALDAGAVSVRTLFAAAELALAFAALMALAMGTAPSRPRCMAAACFFGGSYGAGTAGMYFTCAPPPSLPFVFGFRVRLLALTHALSILRSSSPADTNWHSATSSGARTTEPSAASPTWPCS